MVKEEEMEKKESLKLKAITTNEGKKEILLEKKKNMAVVVFLWKRLQRWGRKMEGKQKENGK